MNIDHLRYFVAATEHQSITRAAKALAVTQSTVSHAIKNLENEVGAELLARNGKKMLPTQKGRDLFQRGRDILLSLEHLKSPGQAGPLAAPATIRVAAPADLMDILAIPLIFQMYDSKRQFEFQCFRSGMIVEKVSRGEIDLGFAMNPIEYPKTVSSEIVSWEMVYAVGSHHPVMKVAATKRVAALSRYPLATTQQIVGGGTCQSTQDPKKHPQYTYDRYKDAAAILNLTDAWAILPKPVVKQNPGISIVAQALKKMVSLCVLAREGSWGATQLEPLVNKYGHKI